MTRGISVDNQAEVDAPHREAVVLAKLEFDTPVYVHSRIGDLVFGGDIYEGVGDLGNVEAVEETEIVAPGSFRLSLSGINTTHIQEALDSGNYGDIVTIYLGFVDDAGFLVSPAVPIARGSYEFATIETGADETKVIITVQHELATLQLSDGSRWTDEDQQRKFPGDTFFTYVADSVEKTLNWGGGVVGGKESDHLDDQGNERDRDFQ